MMINILIHGLKKGYFASALVCDPLESIEQIIDIAQKYIHEEEINAKKEVEWARPRRERERRDEEGHMRDRSGEDHGRYACPKYQDYTPLSTSKTRALMTMEKANVLQWPRKARDTPTKKNSKDIATSIKIKVITLRIVIN